MNANTAKANAAQLLAQAKHFLAQAAEVLDEANLVDEDYGDYTVDNYLERARRELNDLLDYCNDTDEDE